MTVRELKKCCESAIKDGFGDHNVVLANDDEGNGYRDLFYPFMTNQEMVKSAIAFSCTPHDVSDPEHSVILG